MLAQLPNPLRVLSKTQPWGWSYRLLAIGYGLLAIGYERFVIGNWLLAIGDWLLDMGGIAAIRASTLYTLHFTLYTISDSDPVYHLIICQRQCFDADAKQMQEQYEVTRVKTDGQFGRTSYLRPKGDKSIERFEEHLK